MSDKKLLQELLSNYSDVGRENKRSLNPVNAAMQEPGTALESLIIKPYTYVWAGNFQQFRVWCSITGTNPLKAEYITRIDQLATA